MSMILRAGALALTSALCACGTYTAAPAAPLVAPARWQAPLPHHGSQLELADWWQRQSGPSLRTLIDAAQAASPDLAAARARIAEARAGHVAAGALLAPALDGFASASRVNGQGTTPASTSTQAGLQASWEIDLFGGNRAGLGASAARLQMREAAWHDARVSLAAEVAYQYYDWLACQRLQAVARSDAASRADTERLTALSAQAGFESPATLALARASAAEGNGRYLTQRAACDIGVKKLVALTALAEPELRRVLADAAGKMVAEGAAEGAAESAAGGESTPAIALLPASTLSQRPDIFMAERDVAAASADIAVAQAARYPRLTLSGMIGAANSRAGGVGSRTDTWSIGPLALSLPIVDGGRRRADAEAATARYAAAVAGYRAAARRAVSEVEQALVNLDAADARAAGARTAFEGYRANYVAVDERYKSGLASLFELEDARRTRLAAEQTIIQLARERSVALVALYRAAGGGWTGAH